MCCVRICVGCHTALCSRPHGPYSPDDLDQFTQDVRTVSAVPHLRAFTVVDKASELPIGFATVLNNVPAHLKAELGYIWYTPAFHRTYANTDSTHLLLRHLFSLGYRYDAGALAVVLATAVAAHRANPSFLQPSRVEVRRSERAIEASGPAPWFSCGGCAAKSLHCQATQPRHGVVRHHQRRLAGG